MLCLYVITDIYSGVENAISVGTLCLMRYYWQIQLTHRDVVVFDGIIADRYIPYSLFENIVFDGVILEDTAMPHLTSCILWCYCWQIQHMRQY